MKCFTLINLQPVLKHQFFLYDVQQKTIKVYNSAFILLLRSLKFDKQLAMNKSAKVAVQTTIMEQANRSKEAEVPQVRLQNLQPSFLPKTRREVLAQNY